MTNIPEISISIETILSIIESCILHAASVIGYKPQEYIPTSTLPSDTVLPSPFVVFFPVANNQAVNFSNIYTALLPYLFTVHNRTIFVIAHSCNRQDIC